MNFLPTQCTYSRFQLRFRNMRNSRYFPGCGDLRLIEPKATEKDSKATVFSRKADGCDGQNLSLLTSMSEFDKIRGLTIGEAILMFVTPEAGLQ
jgi:hypothetical protein